MNGPSTAISFLRGVRGENRHLIELPVESGDGRWKGDGNLGWRNDFGFDIAWARAERVSRRRMQRRIHQLLHGVGDVFGGERRAIGERDSAAQLKCDLLAVLRDFPRLSQFRLQQPASGGSCEPARLRSNTGSPPRHRLPLSADQMFSVPSAGKTAVRPGPWPSQARMAQADHQRPRMLFLHAVCITASLPWRAVMRTPLPASKAQVETTSPPPPAKSAEQTSTALRPPRPGLPVPSAGFPTKAWAQQRRAREFPDSLRSK